MESEISLFLLFKNGFFISIKELGIKDFYLEWLYRLVAITLPDNKPFKTLTK